MILDILGLIATVIVKICVKGSEKDVLLNKLGDLYVLRDPTNEPASNCGVAILGDKKTVKKVLE